MSRPAPGWRSLVGSALDSVDLRYEPWDEGGALWCRRVDLRIGGTPVVLLLAEGKWESDQLGPSSDNIAVVFDEAAVVPW